MTRLFQELLNLRGFNKSFLNPKYEDLFDPFLLPDMDRAVERILEAGKKSEKVVIYGDYDVDGVTSSVVMREALELAGCEVVEIFLPDRFRDGYGMNMGVISRVKDTGATLLVTVDCGSANADVVKELINTNIDVIVTDHHEVTDDNFDGLIDEAIFINPKRPDCEHGKRLAGVGVAFMLAKAVNAKLNNDRCNGQEKWLLDLVAIGTVCDAMELLEENRILAYYGMKVLEKTRRKGLIALMSVAGIDKGKVSTHAIGFQLGPRLNAGGRLQTANLSLRLLESDSMAEAVGIAAKLNELNLQRRRIQDQALRDIAEGIDENMPIIFARGEWHEGVIGIIAGRLVEEYKKPAMVVTSVESDDDGDDFKDEILKMSGRSFGDFSLAKCLEYCKSLLLKGGGHAAACGATLLSQKYDDFIKSATEYYESLELKNQERFLRKQADLELSDLGEINEEFADELVKLEPFGEGNEEPIFKIQVEVFSKRILKDRHVALNVRDKKGKIFKMMAFFADEDLKELHELDEIELKFTVMNNEFRGERKIDGKIVECRLI